MMLGLALFSSAGCYGYSRTTPSQLTPGSRVAVEVTPRLAAENEQKYGAVIDRLEGVLVDTDADTATLRVTRARTLGGPWAYWARETVTIPVSASTYWGRRSFSGTKTAIATSAIAAIAFSVWKSGLIGGGDGGSDNEPRPIPPVQPGIRLLRF